MFGSGTPGQTHCVIQAPDAELIALLKGKTLSRLPQTILWEQNFELISISKVKGIL